MPGWQSRSVTIDTFGAVEFLHYDFYTQALAKLSRSHERDLHDVTHVVASGFVDPIEFERLFNQVKSQLVRYPGLDEDALMSRVEDWLREQERRR